jgi:hypothetical protein
MSPLDWKRATSGPTFRTWPRCALHLDLDCGGSWLSLSSRLSMPGAAARLFALPPCSPLFAASSSATSCSLRIGCSYDSPACWSSRRATPPSAPLQSNPLALPACIVFCVHQLLFPLAACRVFVRANETMVWRRQHADVSGNMPAGSPSFSLFCSIAKHIRTVRN